MTKTIEARAVISASDNTGSVFDKIAKKVEAIAKAGERTEGLKPFADLNTASVKRTADEMERIQRAWAKFNATMMSNGGKGLGAYKILEARKLFHDHMTDTLNRQRAAMERHAATQDKFMSRARRAAGWAAGAVGVGSVAYGAQRTARAGVTAAATSKRESARDYLAGMTDTESARLSRQSIDLSSRYNSVDASTMHERLRDTAMSLRSVDKASELGDTLAQGTVVLQSLKGKDQAIEEGRKFFRALDVLGKNVDPKQVRGLFDGYIKALGVEGADLNLGGVLQMAKQSRAAGGALSDRFLMTTGVGLQGDMGDAQVGTALSSALSQNIGGRATEKSKKVQQDYGLRDKNGKFLNADKAMSDPDKFAWENVMPAMQKKGVDVNNPIKVAGAAAQLFSNRVVADIFSKMISQREQYQGKAQQYDRAPGLGAAEKLPTKDPFVAYEGMWAQLRNLATQAPGMDAAAAGLSKLSAAIGSFTKSFADDETVSGKVGKGIVAGTAVTATAAGGVMAAKMAYQWLTGAGALTGSAAALNASAAALTSAAAALAGGKSVEAAFSGAGAAAAGAGGAAAGGAASGGSSILSKVGTVAKAGAGLVVTGATAPFVAPAAALAGGLALTGGYDDQSLEKYRARQRRVQNAYEREFREGRDRLGISEMPAPAISPTTTYGTGVGGDKAVSVSVEGKVEGEATVKVQVEAGSSLLQVVRQAETALKLAGQLQSNGPGSTGRSSPDAAAAARPAAGFNGVP